MHIRAFASRRTEMRTMRSIEPLASVVSSMPGPFWWIGPRGWLDDHNQNAYPPRLFRLEHLRETRPWESQSSHCWRTILGHLQQIQMHHRPMSASHHLQEHYQSIVDDGLGHERTIGCGRDGEDHARFGRHFRRADLLGT